ncbi:hypothetical protein HYT91_03090, partial [Candidatus Pacearchaeota archaeon]|nr:hypothetical protein [Candidatus Pacearchaeota archaeon]
EITRQGENLPVLKTQGSIEINPDEKRFLFEGENIIFKTGTNAWPIPEDRQMISGTIPMVFESQNRKVVGLIPENDDKRFYWTTKGGEVSYGPVSEITKEQLGVELPDFITKSWAENSEVWQDRANAISTFANNHKFQESYAKHLAAEKNLDKYIADAQKLEEEILIDSGREKELKEATVNLASGKITNKDFEEIVKKGKDPSMTWDEVEKIIGTDKTKKIKSELKNRAELYQIISSELSKEEDLAKDLDKFKVEGEILKFMSPNELKALNDCVGRGNSFDLCFDENYKYLGLKTLLCITNPEYCKTMTSYQFNKMRVK